MLQQHSSDSMTDGLPYNSVNMPVLRTKHISMGYGALPAS